MSLRPACGGRGGVILYLNPTGDSFLEILSLDRRDVSVMNAAESSSSCDGDRSCSWAWWKLERGTGTGARVRSGQCGSPHIISALIMSSLTVA